MIEEHFNNLSPSELERLAILFEEAAEVVQIVGKIIRHSYASDFVGTTNRKLLEKELGDLIYAVNLMAKNNDISLTRIQEFVNQKAEKIKPYLHHQNEASEAEDVRGANKHC